ncbi:hypothetical protein ACFXIY_10865 [Streptomyces albidoflavus]
MPSTHAQVMNKLIHGERKPLPTAEKSQNVRALFKQGLQELRGNRNLHPEARRVEIARLYSSARDTLKKIRTDQTAADRDQLDKLQRQLWGYDDMRAATYNTADRAALDQTIRDARDRADKLVTPEAAARALHDAESAGDRVLARAIAKRAHDADWDDVLGDYLGTREVAARTYGEAAEVYQRLHTTGAILAQQTAAMVAKPAELFGLTDEQITSMTASDSAA